MRHLASMSQTHFAWDHIHYWYADISGCLVDMANDRINMCRHMHTHLVQSCAFQSENTPVIINVGLSVCTSLSIQSRVYSRASLPIHLFFPHPTTLFRSVCFWLSGCLYIYLCFSAPTLSLSSRILYFLITPMHGNSQSFHVETNVIATWHERTWFTLHDGRQIYK